MAWRPGHDAAMFLFEAMKRRCRRDELATGRSDEEF
jgi:hypothetical protein